MGLESLRQAGELIMGGQGRGPGGSPPGLGFRLLRVGQINYTVIIVPWMNIEEIVNMEKRKRKVSRSNNLFHRVISHSPFFDCLSTLRSSS